MKKTILLLTILLLSSCSLIKFDINGIPREAKVVQRMNKELWLGRPLAEVMTHKAFAVLPFEKREGVPGSMVLVFKNSGGHYSSSNCAAYGNWGGCSAIGSEIVCNHVFSIEENKIKDYDRIGACLDEEDPKFRPTSSVQKISKKEIKRPVTRTPASIETKRLFEIDERRGCCSHHGGVSHCSSGSLFCQDGWVSGCGC